MTKKVSLDTLKSVLGRSILHYSEASILKAEQIPLEVLGQPKTPKMKKLFFSLLHSVSNNRKL